MSRSSRRQQLLPLDLNEGLVTVYFSHLLRQRFQPRYIQVRVSQVLARYRPVHGASPAARVHPRAHTRPFALSRPVAAAAARQAPQVAVVQHAGVGSRRVQVAAVLGIKRVPLVCRHIHFDALRFLAVATTTPRSRF